MILELEPNLRFATPADEASVARAAVSLRANGMGVFRADDAAEAKRIVLGLIPVGAKVYHGASETLDVSGITAAIQAHDHYDLVRAKPATMDRGTQGDQIRRLSSTPDVMLGSVHALTESGALVIASMSGSQLGPYVTGAGRVIFVVGIQKIVSDLEEGLRRIDEYSYPLEDARAQAAYGVRSSVNKILIIKREITPGRITVVLVDEVLGF